MGLLGKVRRLFEDKLLVDGTFYQDGAEFKFFRGHNKVRIVRAQNGKSLVTLDGRVYNSRGEDTTEYTYYEYFKKRMEREAEAHSTQPGFRQEAISSQ